MQLDELDARMRAGEAFHSLRVPPCCWTILRVDGRSFTGLTKKHYEHPFDERFHVAMIAAATERQATSALHRQGVYFKNELLFQHGINFNKTPLWQRRGTLLYWERYEKIGFNPITGENVKVMRRRLRSESEPPTGDEYSVLIRRLMAMQEEESA